MRQLFGKLLLIGFVLTFVLLPAGAALRGPALPGTAVWADTNVDEAYSDDEADYEEPADEPAVLPDQRLKPRLTDDADLLTSSEEKQLLAKLDEISERQQMDVIVVTTDSLEGKTAEAYADDFFDYNGFGYGPMGSGVLLLVSMEDRDWAISTSGDGIEAFTDAGQEYLSDSVVPYLSDGDYAGGFNAYADLCDQYITEWKSGEAYDNGNMPNDAEKKRAFRLSMIPGAGLIGFLMALARGKRKESAQKTVHHQMTALDYMVRDGMRVDVANDRFINATTMTRRIQKNKNTGGGGHGSSTHMGSSGHVHGGSSGKF